MDSSPKLFKSSLAQLCPGTYTTRDNLPDDSLVNGLTGTVVINRIFHYIKLSGFKIIVRFDSIWLTDSCGCSLYLRLFPKV